MSYTVFHRPLKMSVTRNASSLAASLRQSNAKASIKDIIYDILNVHNYSMKTRTIIARCIYGSGFTAALAINTAGNILTLPQFSLRADNFGLIAAIAPWLFGLYVWDKHLRHSIISRKKPNIMDRFLFLSIVPILLILDTPLTTLQNNILTLAAFSLAALFFSPLRKRRSYYTKKHIDKRTK